jgi:hypothetical protein
LSRHGLALGAAAMAIAAACSSAAAPSSEDTSVGVIFYSPYSVTTLGDCPPGARREQVTIRMVNELTSPCSTSTGTRGEGAWVLPQAQRPSPSCQGAVDQTDLQLCRVPGDLFRATTFRGDSVHEFYAVLKLGDRCPDDAIEIAVRIDDEDDPGPGRNSEGRGPIRPNEVITGPLGTVTVLYFCYFRAAEFPDATMSSFPDLGVSYAVFHAFEGEQPSWVLSKRWQCGKNEDTFGAPGDPYRWPGQEDSSFRQVIAASKVETCFNMARVR